VVLVIALAPIVALYLIWLPLTCLGKVKAADVPENEAFGRPSESQPPVEEDPMDRESECEDSKVNISEVCAGSSSVMAGSGGSGGSESGGKKYTAEGVQGSGSGKNSEGSGEAHADALHTIPV